MIPLYCKAFWEDHQNWHNSTSYALTVAVCWLKWSGEEEGGKWDKLWWLRTSLGDILPGRAPRFGNKVRNINTPGQDPSSEDLLPSRWWYCYHVKNWTNRHSQILTQLQRWLKKYLTFLDWESLRQFQRKVLQKMSDIFMLWLFQWKHLKENVWHLEKYIFMMIITEQIFGIFRFRWFQRTKMSDIFRFQ